MGKLEDQMNQDQIERATSVPLAKVRTMLKDHWLAGIRCDHANKTDKASCACSEMPGPECNSVGEAVDSWIDHFIETLQA